MAISPFLSSLSRVVLGSGLCSLSFFVPCSGGRVVRFVLSGAGRFGRAARVLRLARALGLPAAASLWGGGLVVSVAPPAGLG